MRIIIRKDAKPAKPKPAPKKKKKKTREDFSQAAARIVREATEKTQN